LVDSPLEYRQLALRFVELRGCRLIVWFALRPCGAATLILNLYRPAL